MVFVVPISFQDSKLTIKKEKSDNMESLIASARKEYEEILNIAERIPLEGEGYSCSENTDFKETVSQDMFFFLTALIVSDGQAHPKEIEILNGVLGGTYSVEDVIQHIKRNEELAVVGMLPLGMEYRSVMKNKLCRQHDYISKVLFNADSFLSIVAKNDNTTGDYLSERYIEAIGNLGRTVIAIDGDQDRREIDFLTNYIFMLKECVETERK